MRKPYLEDTYGGKTPEETWAMFLDALKKGNVELASKYFWVERQEEMKQFILRQKMSGLLDSWLKDLETMEVDNINDSVPEQDKKYFVYKYFNKEVNRDIWSPVVLTLNPYTKIWKISVL